MRALTLFLCSVSFASRLATRVEAQSPATTSGASKTDHSRLEIGFDQAFGAKLVGTGASSETGVISLFFGGVSTKHRFSLESRLSVNDRRITGALSRNSVSSALQANWRLGSRDAVASRVTGAFAMFAVSAAQADSYIDGDVFPGSPTMFGFAAGVGKRIPFGNDAVRLTALVGRDLGYRTSASAYSIPARTFVSVRLGYSSLHF